MSLIAENLSKSFSDGKSRREVLRSLSFEIEYSSLTGISGSSGIGKTTLLKILLGLSQPDEGKLFLDEQELGLEDEDIALLFRRRIGFLIQGYGLIDEDSVSDNLMVPLNFGSSDIANSENKSLVKEKIASILQILELDFPLRKKVKRLSQGQKQRVCIARALLPGHKIIILDEPTTALDRDRADIVIRELLKEKDKGTMVIVASHDETLLNACDKRITLTNA